MTGKLNFDVGEKLSEEDQATIDRGLTEFNEENADLSTVRPLSVVARNEAGAVTGGLIGRTWGECCELLVLWVDADSRREGIGGTLMRKAEDEAARRGCHTVFLVTFSFQASDFYERLGYEKKHSIEGMPDGICKFYMLRPLRD
jgi:ribosomal protein S18 acetylase RimI-like enzyme